MDSRVYSVLIWLHLFFERSNGATDERFPIAKGFLAYRTITSYQKYCSCSTSYSCSCCQSVLILFSKAEKNLCVNFTYQRNGFNVDVTLNSETIRTRTITDYKPFKFCSNIPGCYFSTTCINVLELNRFPRSITACLRLDIFSKKKIWQLNYDCVSISTELPMVQNNRTTTMTSATTKMTGTSKATNTTQTMMPTTQMMTTTMMAPKTEVETEETTIPGDVEVLTTTEIMDID